MRVALSGWFWDRPDTGSGQVLRRLVETLARSQPGVALTLFLPGRDLPGDLPPGVGAAPVPAASGPLGKLWWEQVSLPRAVRRVGADLLHVPYWGSPWRATVPVAVTVHDLIPLILPAYRASFWVRLYTALVGATARRAALIFTDSEAARSDILRHLRVAEARVRAVHLAADVHYHPAVPLDALASMQLMPGYVLYLGGFDIRKNLATLMAAMTQVRTDLPDARLVIAGRLPAVDSAFAPDPRRLARAAGLPESTVHFTGFIPEAAKPALYRGARAFVFLSRYEGFGLPPLEALACGTPVVASDVASLPEVVGEGGVLVPPDDAEAAAAALVRLLRDDPFHAALQERALIQAARFSWERTAEQTAEGYRSLLGA